MQRVSVARPVIIIERRMTLDTGNVPTHLVSIRAWRLNRHALASFQWCVRDSRLGALLVIQDPERKYRALTGGDRQDKFAG
jgi:hypothetical protein